MVLLCAGHCSLALLIPLFALTLSVAGAYFGLPLTWVVPPILISGLFLWLIWPNVQGKWERLQLEVHAPTSPVAIPAEIESR